MAAKGDKSLPQSSILPFLLQILTSFLFAGECRGSFAQATTAEDSTGFGSCFGPGGQPCTVNNNYCVGGMETSMSYMLRPDALGERGVQLLFPGPKTVM